RGLKMLSAFAKRAGLQRRPVPPFYHFTEFGKHQILVTGEAFEYVVTSRGKQLQIDGFAKSTVNPGLLDIVEAKYGNPFLSIEESGHLPWWPGKQNQLTRLAQFAKY